MSTYTIGTPPEDVTFHFTDGPDGTVTQIYSSDFLVSALIGETGIGFTSPIPLTLAESIADAIYVLAYP